MRQRAPLVIVHFSLLFLWAGAIAWLSLGAPPAVDIGVLSWDKLLHGGAYGLLMLLALWWYADFRPLDLRGGGICWVAVVLYGGLLEIGQLLLTRSRTAEWWDLVADGIGAAAALAVGLLLKRYRWIN